MLESLTEYFATSWYEYYLTDIAATLLIFWSMYLLTEKKRSGFLVNFLASILWIVWHGAWGSLAGMVMNIFLCFINVYGWVKWKKN